MTTQAQPERFVVLAAFDGVGSDEVVTVAARFAASIAGGELHLVHAIGRAPAEGAARKTALGEARTRLEDAGIVAGKVYKPTIVGHMAIGDPLREILAVAGQLEADLLLVGTHGKKGPNGAPVGSLADHLVRDAACPVLVVREKNYHTEPEIEPPCPDCVQVRSETKGQTMWCARHSQPHPHGHAMYEIPESFALGSSIIRPD